MSFDSLPDELIALIMDELMVKSGKDCASLASACKRLNRIYESRRESRYWVEHNRLPFDLYLDESKYRIANRLELGDSQCNCEELPVGIYENACYYQRFICLMTTKHRFFSALHFRRAYLYRCECFDSIEKASILDKTFTQLHINAIVQITLYDCCITVEWLDSLLVQLPNVRHLDIGRFKVGYRMPEDMRRTRQIQASQASRTMNHLGVMYTMSAPIFNYTLNNFPAIELDITKLSVMSRSNEVRPHVIRFDDDRLRPSRNLSPMAVLPYLIRNKSIVRRLIVGCVEKMDGLVERILSDPDLKHIEIQLGSPSMLGFKGR